MLVLTSIQKEFQAKGVGCMIATNIKWDTDGDKELLSQLPESVEVPKSMTDIDEISDFLSDTYGFCHTGFDLACV
jgi:hypothetical protein